MREERPFTLETFRTGHHYRL